MHKFFNACLVLAVLVSAFFLYSLNVQRAAISWQIAKLRNGFMTSVDPSSC